MGYVTYLRCQAGSSPPPGRLNAVFTSGPGCPLTPPPPISFQTYYGHEREDVVLQVAAVVLHHLAVGHQHDFNEAGVGQEALRSPVGAGVALVGGSAAGAALRPPQGLANQPGAERLQVAEEACSQQRGRVGQGGPPRPRPSLWLVPLGPVLVSWKDGNEKQSADVNIKTQRA